jgi:hypothetical protein
VVVSAPVDSESLTLLLPLQLPVAVQLVAFVEDHDNIDAAPLAMDPGFARMLTDGGGAISVTAMIVVAWVFPPAFAQLRVNVLVAVSGPMIALPTVSFAPDHAPRAVHCIASTDDHVSVAEPPLAIV